MILLILALCALAAFVIAAAVPKPGLHHGGGTERWSPPMEMGGTLLLTAICIWAYRHVPPTRHEGTLTVFNYANFALSWIGCLLLSIWLFRGSWRGALRFPLHAGVVAICVGHVLANPEQRGLVFFGALAAIAFVSAVLAMKNSREEVVPEVRDGHNLLSMIIGTAIYGLFVQIHLLVTGIPAFELLK